MTFAINITGDIFSRPPKLYQSLFQMAAFTGMNNNGGVIDSGSQKGCNFFAFEDLLENGNIEGLEDQSIRWITVNLQAAIS
jgi:hypothetical protein